MCSKSSLFFSTHHEEIPGKLTRKLITQILYIQLGELYLPENGVKNKLQQGSFSEFGVERLWERGEAV